MGVAVMAATAGVNTIITGSGAGAATSSTPIVVGSSGDLEAGSGTAQGFKAGIYRFNKEGGLDGRKIVFDGILDDGFSPATALTNTQELVQNKHIFANIPTEDYAGTAAVGQYLEENKVPMIGWATSPEFGTPKWAFGINGYQLNPAVQGEVGATQILQALGDVKTPKKVKMAYIGPDLASGVSATNGVAGVGTHSGIDEVYKATPIAAVGTTNYQPYAQAIIASGANAVYEVLGTPDAVGLAAALTSAGFKGAIVNGVTYLPGQLTASSSETAALNGVYVEDQYPADENNTAATKQALKDLAATGQPPGLSSPISIGYWSAIVFEQMLRATLRAVGGDPNKVTSAALEKTVNAGFTYTDPIAGGIGTEYFPAAETVPTGCGTLLKIEGTKFHQIEPYTCSDAVVNYQTGKDLSKKTGKPVS
jgi:ABC-type branched-subunit amino acid transport system substrate-binding protein